MTWRELCAGSRWFHSPHLRPWQKKIVTELKLRLAADAQTFWVLSSGTQSKDSVKAIGLSEQSLLRAASGANRHLHSTKADRWLVAIPAYHIGGLAIYARAHLSGAKVFSSPGPWRVDTFCRALERHHITLTSLVPTQIYDLVTARQTSPRKLRAVVVGGGALDPALYLEARALGWPLLPSYGLSECGSQVATAPLASLKSRKFPDFVVLPHVQVELRAKRLFLKSAALCRAIAIGHRDGLFTLEDARRDSWLGTQDMARWRKGKLQILGRSDEVVKVLGVLVPVPEVEHEVREHFLRAGFGGEFVVVTTTHARAGLHLVLVTDSADSLRKLYAQVAIFNRGQSGPRRLHGLCWIAKIPRNEIGKLAKVKLARELFAPDST